MTFGGWEGGRDWLVATETHVWTDAAKEESLQTAKVKKKKQKRVRWMCEGSLQRRSC